MTTPNLTRKGNTWNWTQYHKWKERENKKIPQLELINKNTKIFGIGSCFAQNVIKFLAGKNVNGQFFPGGRYYDTASMCQEFIHLLEKPVFEENDIWKTDQGEFAHPFRDPRYRTKSVEELMKWSEDIDEKTRKLFFEADLIVMTLGGTEVWRHPVTKKVYATIPFPDVFNTQMPEIAECHTLSFNEVYSQLEKIYQLIRAHNPKANIIFTVSPHRMTFTVSDKDVELATCQGKSTLRAAIGELVDQYKENLYYFHSFEIVEYCKYPELFFDDQMRHVNDHAINTIMNEFLHYFCAKELHNERERSMLKQAMNERDAFILAESVKSRKKLTYKFKKLKALMKI